MISIFGSLVFSLICWSVFLFFFNSGIFPLEGVDKSNISKWINDSFVKSSGIVIFITFATALLWNWIATRIKHTSSAHEFEKFWWGLVALPVGTIVLVYFTFQGKVGAKGIEAAIVPVIVSYFIHLIIIYWIGTCLCGELFAKNVPPLSPQIRRIASSMGIPVS